MTDQTAPYRQQNTASGVLMMLGAFVMYTGIDTFSKALGEMGYHPVMITWGRTAIQILMITPFLLHAGGMGAFATAHPKMQLLRGVVMTFAGIFFVSGLAYLPLATMTAINFINPFLITILSIFVLGEQVGRHRWVAIALGFFGALVIIRPGLEGFHPAGLFSVAAAFCWAISVIATRLVQDRDSGMVTMFWSALIGVGLTSAIVPFIWQPFGTDAIPHLIGMGVCSLAGQGFMIAALRHASPSLLAPLGYSQLIWATIVGYFLFGNLPDGWTWVGAGIIVLSGLYMWWREQKAADS